MNQSDPTKPTNADNTEALLPWNTPRLRGIDAREAEINPGAATDGFSNTS